MNTPTVGIRCRRAATRPPVTAAITGIAVAFFFCARSNAQTGPTIGTRLSNASDCVEIRDLTVVGDGGQEVETIGVVAGHGRDTVVNVGTMTITSDAAGSDGTVNAVATGITADREAGGRGDERKPGREHRCEGPNPPAHGHDTGVYDTVENQGSMEIVATAAATNATAPLTVTSTTLGIEGAAENDLIVNSGSLQVTATTTASIAELADEPPATELSEKYADSGSEPPGHAKGPQNASEQSRHARDDDDASSGASSVASSMAEAVAIASGAGDDNIRNSDLVAADATATLDAGVVDFGVVGGTTLAATDARARAVGIDAGIGDDRVTNSGSLQIDATADNRAGNFSASLATGPALNWNGGAAAAATATGVDGGEGVDRLRNIEGGEIAVDARATARAGSLEIAGGGFTSMLTSSSAEALASGLAGGAGDDRIRNVGALTATSFADALSVGVGITGAGVTIVQDALVDAGTRAFSTSAGILGGDGADRIRNSGALTAEANAIMLSSQTALTPLGVSIVDAAGVADAQARGIDAGIGDDRVRNFGAVTASTTVLAQSLDIALTGLGMALSPAATGGPLVGYGPFADGRTVANATTVGIEGGLGSDVIKNATGGTVSSYAFADTFASGVTATFSRFPGQFPGRLLANTYVDIATHATATATGIGGDLARLSLSPGGLDESATREPPPDGDDRIRNFGTVDVDALSRAAVVEANFGLAGETVPGLGIALGIALGKGGAYSSATGVGLDGGGGKDVLVNAGTVDVNAESDLPSFGLSLRITNGPSVELASESSSSAMGLRAGAGDDVAVNRGTILATADSDAFSLGIGVTGRGLFSGVSSGLSLDSVAIGVDGGAGRDTLLAGEDLPGSASSITARASAIGTGVNVLVNFGRPDDPSQPPAVGYSAVSTEAASAARAIGINADSELTSTTTDLPLYGNPLDLGINHRTIETAASDADLIVNRGLIDADALARAITVGAVGQSRGITEAKTTVSAEAEAAAVVAGGGDDVVRNFGLLQSDAIANSDALTFSFTAERGYPGVNLGGTTTRAHAVGIDADDRIASRTTELDVGEGLISLPLGFERASGDDLVVNENEIDTFSRALTLSADGAVVTKRWAAGSTNSSTDASSVAIDGGGGSDVVRNSGALTAEANATTTTVAAAVTLQSGLATALSKGSESNARAVGISADGDVATSTTRGELHAASSAPKDGEPEDPAASATEHADVRLTQTTTGNSGDDRVRNSGRLETAASAFNVEGTVAVTVSNGVAAAFTDSVAHTDSIAIETGGGDDRVVNSGELVSRASTNADAVGVSVTTTGVAAVLNKLVDGGTLGTASAVGIDAGGVESTSREIFASGDFGSDPLHIASEVTVTDSSMYAEDRDRIRNEGKIETVATAIVPQVGVAVSMRGVAGAITTATADAEAVAIRAGGGDDVVRNKGKLDATAWANADTVNVTYDPAGVGLTANSIFDGGVVGTARAAGIETDGLESVTRARTIAQDDFDLTISDAVSQTFASGDDVVVNKGLADTDQGEIDVTVRSIVPSLAGAYSGAGVAGVVATAESDAFAAAIDTGGGDDVIRNSARLGVTSLGNADVINVSVVGGGVALAADAVWDGGAASTSVARGIDADGRYASLTESTTLTFRTPCDAECDADAPPEGLAIERIRAETFAAGDDAVVNRGDVTTTARAFSPSIGVSVVTTGGPAVVVTAATADAESTAIDVGAGADRVRNVGELSSTAFANADAVSVAYSTAGVGAAGNGVWQGGTTATARASGIAAGGLLSRTDTVAIKSSGDDKINVDSIVEQDQSEDVIRNEGKISANANSFSPAVSVAVTPAGVSAAVSTATSHSIAEGIDTGGGGDRVKNTAEITADAFSTAIAINVGVTPAGVALAGDAFWDGGTHATARSAAIDVGEGADTVRNSGRLEAYGDAIAASAAVPVAVYGVGLGISTATSEAQGFGIAAGAGDDFVVSSGEIETFIRANAESIGVAVNVFGVAGTGNAAWDGGVTAYSNTAAIAAGAGDDVVHSTARLHATGRASSISGQIGFSYGGLAAAVSTSTAGSNVDGIELGLGRDRVVNEGDIRAESFATAVAVNGTLGVFGGAVSADAVWNGGTTAVASVDGIDGGEGRDAIRNEAIVDVDALARANGDDVALSLIGVTGSLSTSTSEARATGLAGGAGKDRVVNDAEVHAQADARATSVAVSISGLGGAAALDATWDGGTGADATAFGIAGGDGKDRIRNRGLVESVAIADTDFVGVAGTLGIVAAATGGSEAIAHSTGLDGGESKDLIVNEDRVTVSSTADAGNVGISVIGLGAAIADSFVENATRAEAHGTGLGGGGGRDRIELTETSGVDVTATAAIKASNFVFQMGGFGRADSTAFATANAIGVDGGDDKDRIVLDGTLTSTAIADVFARAFDITVVGDGLQEIRTGGEAWATGVAGGAGDDVVKVSAPAEDEEPVSEPAVTVNATATNVGKSFGLNGTGTSFGDAGTTAAAHAFGIDAGTGDDRIVAADWIDVTATSDVTARSFGLDLLGYTANRADATADSFATGIAAGDGFDRIHNSARVAATADATATSFNRSVNIFGRADTDAGSHANATATGIEGGEDRVVVANTGGVDASASAGTSVSGYAFTFGGATSVEPLSSASATAVGISGGALRDRITNDGTVAVDAEFTIDSGGASRAVFGAPGANATITGSLSATGLAGQAGDDDLLNFDTIDVSTTSTINSSAGTWTIGGSAGASAGITGTADLGGMVGGRGADWIRNAGALTVTGTGGGLLSGASWTFAGTAADTAVLSNEIDATGADGGDDDDTIESDGSIAVSIANALTIDGGPRTMFGSANGGANLTLTSNGFGLLGGGGNDTLVNRSDLTVTTEASLTTTSVASTFIGGATNTLTTAVVARAVGIGGDDGDDDIVNSGSIAARATATMDASGGTAARVGDAVATATTDATAAATGVSAGTGDDDLDNRGAITATAAAALSGTTQASSGGLFVDGTSRAETNAVLTAIGAALGDGDDESVSSGQITATVTGTNTAAAASTGIGIGGLTSTARSTADADSNDAAARGLDLGDGINGLINEGELTALASQATTADASADGSGLVEGNGIATADAFGEGTHVVGIRGGADADVIDNLGIVRATAQPVTSSEAVGDADGINFFEAARSEGNAEVVSDGVTATGIDAGGGDNTIATRNSLVVLSAPTAATAQATADWRARNDGNGSRLTLAVDAFATAGASANGAKAVGIAAGDGVNHVRNDGVIDVASRPSAVADAVARGAGWDGDATALATALANDAEAVGILLGNGGNVVLNNGTIVVSAEPTSTATAEGVAGLAQTSEQITITVTQLIPQRFGLLRRIVGYVTQTVTRVIVDPIVDEGELEEEATAEALNAKAIGIQTGAGDDHVANNGLIQTSIRTTVSESNDEPAQATERVGTGISVGAGNDTVVFGDGSAVIGHVDLGDGDDTLALRGVSVVVGETRGGDGSDSLVLKGAGGFDGELLDFERARKIGAGTFELYGLPTLDELYVDTGTLSVAGDYLMAPSGLFQTIIYAAGETGRLQASGNVGLDGSLAVLRDDGLYHEGDRFEIVAASAVTGEFDTIELPEPTPIVTFGIEQTPDAVTVVADVESFDVVTAAANFVEAGMAEFLDDASVDASGPLAALLGKLQAVGDADQLQESLTGLSPASYNNLSQTAASSIRIGDALMRDRLALLRSQAAAMREGERQSRLIASTTAVPFVAAKLDGNLGAWVSYATTSGEQSGSASGYGAFEFDTHSFEAGVSVAVGSNWLVGARIADTDTAAMLYGTPGHGAIEGQQISLYGGYSLPNRFYAQAGVSFGENEFRTARGIESDALSGIARAEYGGDYRSSFVELGRTFGAGSMQSELFGLLSYLSLYEDGFSESGGGVTSFDVAARNASATSSELGGRFSWNLDLGRGRLTPSLSLAWLHDINVSAPQMIGRLSGTSEGVLRLSGHEVAHDAARWGVGLDFSAGETRTWSLRWSGEQRSDYADSGALVQFSALF